ncbi:hypothetical protein CsatB_000899 [Cannabis sativa]
MPVIKQIKQLVICWFLLHHIKQIWRDTENFENSVSRQLAKGLISEYQLKFNSAKGLISEIYWNMLAVPPTTSYKSDPIVVIYTKERDETLIELGRTEVILNSVDPTWITKHTLTYHFEVVQYLVFRVYDIDTQFHNVDVKV